MPGFAAFHVGIQTDEAPVEEKAGTVDVHERQRASNDYVDGMSE